MRVLITGASGFIGGFLVQEALDRGYEVWAAVRSSSSCTNLQDKRINFIELRYNDDVELARQLNNFVEIHGEIDYVIHNAGLTKAINKSQFREVNALYTDNLVKALQSSCRGLKKFLLMSSLSSYGVGDEKTFSPIRLNDPQNPNTAYGKSKLEAENYLRSKKNFPYVILRPTGVYGPGEKDYFMEIQSINSGFDFAAGLVHQRITFIYVKDLARVAFMALEGENIQNKEYFVSDGDIHTDKSFACMIQDILKKKFVLRARIPLWVVYIACVFSELIGRIAGKSMTLNTDKYKILKQRNWVCDITPLKEDLNFTAEYPLRKGLEETIEWYKQQKWI
jgi:Nucleoside-diphosphate-sugar epimerases